jgi:hypothetical protein
MIKQALWSDSVKVDTRCRGLRDARIVSPNASQDVKDLYTAAQLEQERRGL